MWASVAEPHLLHRICAPLYVARFRNRAIMTNRMRVPEIDVDIELGNRTVINGNRICPRKPLFWTYPENLSKLGHIDIA